MPDAVRYPLDFDGLKKGDVLESPFLVELFGVPTDSAAFSSRQVDLAFTIEREMKQRGRNVVAATVKNEIHILDDATAVDYTAQLGKKAVRQLRRAFRKAAEIDRGNLDGEQLRTHDRSLVKLSAFVLAVDHARREIAPITHKRSVPPMLMPPE